MLTRLSEKKPEALLWNSTESAKVWCPTQGAAVVAGMKGSAWLAEDAPGTTPPPSGSTRKTGSFCWAVLRLAGSWPAPIDAAQAVEPIQPNAGVLQLPFRPANLPEPVPPVFDQRTWIGRFVWDPPRVKTP